MTGHILVADSFTPDRLLLKHHLGLFGLHATAASSRDMAVEILSRETIDVVLYGLSLRAAGALDTIAAVRGQGFEGPLLVLTAESDTRLLERAREAGATDVMIKPYYVDLLLAQLQVHLLASTPETSEHSTVMEQSGMPPLIRRYVQQVRRTADQIEWAFAEGALAELRERCQQLKGSGASYGFRNLTVTAMRALKAIDEDPESDETLDAINRLLRGCRTLSFAQPASDAG